MKDKTTSGGQGIDAFSDALESDSACVQLVNQFDEVLERTSEAVETPDHEHGGQKSERLRVIDWGNPEANDFLLVNQFSVVGPLYTCRPDLVGFVNGLPWVVIELKKPGF